MWTSESEVPEKELGFTHLYSRMTGMFVPSVSLELLRKAEVCASLDAQQVQIFNQKSSSVFQEQISTHWGRMGIQVASSYWTS